MASASSILPVGQRASREWVVFLLNLWTGFLETAAAMSSWEGQWTKSVPERWPFPGSLSARFQDGVPQWLYVLEEVVELDLGLSRGKAKWDSNADLSHLPASSAQRSSALSLPVAEATLCPDRAEVIQEPEWKFSSLSSFSLRMTSSP